MEDKKPTLKMVRPFFMISKNWISILPEISISINGLRYRIPNIQIDIGFLIFHAQFALRTIERWDY